MKNFDIYFFGQIADGNDPELVRKAISERFKISGSKIDALFSDQPTLIKSDVDVNGAGKYREVFRQAGALVEIVPTGQKPVAPKLDTAKELPEKTSNPEDDLFDLAPVGSLFPQTATEPEPDIQISHMQMSAANTGSLAEFAMEVHPAPIPDISQLRMVVSGSDSLNENAPQKPPAPIPSIDHLQAAPANTGSLEDCAAPVTPAPIPDISNLRLVSSKTLDL